jgi:hypothetical protein
VNLARKLLGGTAAALICACSGSTSPSSGTVILVSNVTTLNNDGSLANITATVTDAQGLPGTGSITFNAPGGNLNGTGTTTATVPLDATGHATVTYACDYLLSPTGCGAGSIQVTAIWNSVANGTRVTLLGPAAPVTDAGTPPPSGGPPDAGTVGGPVGPPTSVLGIATAPLVLGIKGSGIQETGLTRFLVTDAAGRAVSNAGVSFAQAQPALVTLGHTVGVTASDGTVSVDYTAGSVVGVSAITATVGGGGPTGSYPLAVRGAKPSASGFYFRCAQTNLPVYTTTLEYETTTCTVRLSDRYGNRVGIATPVSFAAEAGSISASVLTKPFSFANPTDPDEGSLTVTFSSDMGNGFYPADTTPLPADATQFPKPRALEPSNGSLNPRDNLVTIIAMVRGEEAFVDANLDGQYNAGELFVDQGDPFIDSNDNNAYDPATEPRFCGGASCATYHGPNGVWDPDRTIWAPTWVAFSGVVSGGIAPWTPGSCIDYIDNNLSNPSMATATVTMVDQWLNIGPIGQTYAATLIGSPTGVKLTVLGGFAELDNTGSSDVSWEKVSAANPTTACTVANTVASNGACVMQTELGGWDKGTRMGLQIEDGNKSPSTATPAPGHACGTKTPGTNVGTFTVDVTTTGPHVTTHSSTSGTYGY